METKKAATKRVNSFAPKKFEEHHIVDSDGKVVGHVRVKPSGILWSPKNGKDWYGLSLSDFGDYAVKNGKKQSK
ncbi:hypothetical protein [Montanilutibacter psychrotolerans]|uniref:hypothetical protein n=1 Tax=Montanilutibacter psychrotolerans TaxID=1327343 RepID=UPI0011CE89AB|nr:hypothetical protein [Lysobacter psychrotolerans]